MGTHFFQHIKTQINIDKDNLNYKCECNLYFNQSIDLSNHRKQCLYSIIQREDKEALGTDLPESDDEELNQPNPSIPPEFEDTRSESAESDIQNEIIPVEKSAEEIKTEWSIATIETMLQNNNLNTVEPADNASELSLPSTKPRNRKISHCFDDSSSDEESNANLIENHQAAANESNEQSASNSSASSRSASSEIPSNTFIIEKIVNVALIGRKIDPKKFDPTNYDKTKFLILGDLVDTTDEEKRDSAFEILKIGNDVTISDWMEAKKSNKRKMNQKRTTKQKSAFEKYSEFLKKVMSETQCDRFISQYQKNNPWVYQIKWDKYDDNYNSWQATENIDAATRIGEYFYERWMDKDEEDEEMEKIVDDVLEKHKELDEKIAQL